MFEKTNLETQLYRTRNKRTTPEDLLREVAAILEDNAKERESISDKLKTASVEDNSLNLDLLETEKIFHIEDIKKLCITYRLRFLDSRFFKGEIPEEAISKIRQLEKEHDAALSGFKIVAPAKRLKLENADDPLLFAPLGNDYYYLVHKWGNDLHPFRKLLMWPYKNFENLVFTVFLLSIVLTAITPMKLFTHGEVSMQEYFLMFLFMFKAVGGIVLYYGFAKGKNFNGAIWDSKYYNA
ncbi:hypothetical protein J1N09_07050 [Aureitalea sp. L0-47]|uniref:hypothetical protein n=1 Tax=Aureitalea sp. L0-47 TaxID=2816962 RepID=UPI0022389A0C|nr:hypothetical protein [Aureitalea sp. L0-47]MCW5519589.1 hypothetical protein [Aureitalea sp. L0-47]